MQIDKLRTIWDAHAKAVYAHLLRLTKSEADAKDHLQDLFCRLAKQPQLFEQLDGNPRGWLICLARNAVVDEVRRGQARERMFERINAGRPDETVDADDPDHPLMRQALIDALAQLPEEQRVVVHARLWKHRTLDEIARELGISINTAASRYRYGLDKMRGLLRSLYEDFAPRASQPLNSKMKTNSNDPFNQPENEAPIIQPLEQRRVPSATGASFALEALPAEEADDADYSEEFVDEPVEVVDEKVIEIGDEEGFEGELPVTFEDAIGSDGEVLSGDDVVWAYSEIFMTMAGGEVVDVPAEGEGEPVEGEVTDEEQIDEEVTGEEGDPEPDPQVGDDGQPYDPSIAYSGVPVGEEYSEGDAGYNGVEAVKRTVDGPAEPAADSAHLEVTTVSLDAPISASSLHAGEVIELGAPSSAVLPVIDHSSDASEVAHVSTFTSTASVLESTEALTDSSHDLVEVPFVAETTDASFALQSSDALAASTVDQWVPLHDFSDDQLASLAGHESIVLDQDFAPAALQPIVDPMSATSNATLQSSSIAMAATGAAVLTAEVKDRKKNAQD